jgi:DNA-binding winged helix-turn-helix (wHTH) protein/tetratricopeptide (TPR) repeat protein
MRVMLTNGWVDVGEGVVVRHDVTTPLTQNERALLAYLVERPGAVVERADLLRKVWGYASTSRTRTVDVTMRRLREKVEVDPSEPAHFITVVGRGYRFVPLSSNHLLVGRDSELAQLQAEVRSGHKRLLLVGPGGVGKTTLARVWAGQHAKAVVVELLGMQTSAECAGAVRDGLGLVGEAVVDAALRDALRARTQPLLLDNLDDLNDAARKSLGDMLASFEGVVVGTCRCTGRFTGERIVRVAPLTQDASVQLMNERLSDVGVEASVASIERLVRLTDGLPLAIELAAVRARSLGVEGLVCYLPNPSLLVDPGRQGSHRSLSALMESCWDPLSAELRWALKALASLVGTFTLARAEIVLGDSVAVLVAQLCERSLVQREPRTMPARFRLLDTVRSFARKQTMASERQQLDGEWVTFAEAVGGQVLGEQPDLLCLLGEARDDLLGVFERREGQRAGITVLLYGALYFSDRLSTLKQRLDVALNEDSGPWRGELLLYRGWTHRRLGRADHAIDDGNAVLQCSASTSEVMDEARLLIGQCLVYTDADNAIESLCSLAREAPVSLKIRGMAYTGLGHAYRRLDRLVDARDAYETAAGLLVDSQHRLRCAPLIGLGNLALSRGELMDAERAYQQAAVLAEHANDAHTQAVLAANLGVVMLAQHRWDEASEALHCAAVQHTFLGRARSRVMALYGCGRAHWLAGRPAKAHEVLVLALALANRGNNHQERVWISLSISMVEAERGRLDEARRLLAESQHEPGLAELAQVALALAEANLDQANVSLVQARSVASKELEPELTHFATALGIAMHGG